jgi:hypothetical protein
MAKGNSGTVYPNPYNETNPGDDPDAKLYFSYDEVMAAHLTSADMTETPNSKSGGGTMGGPAKGEPNPGKMGD